jgi:hypothetical protein
MIAKISSSDDPKREVIICLASVVLGSAAALVWEQLNPYARLGEEVIRECGEMSFVVPLGGGECFAEFEREHGIHPNQLYRLALEYEEQVIYPAVIAVMAVAIGLFSRKWATLFTFGCTAPIVFLSLRESAWLWGRRIGYCFLYPLMAVAVALVCSLLRRVVLSRGRSNLHEG